MKVQLISTNKRFKFFDSSFDTRSDTITIYSTPTQTRLRELMLLHELTHRKLYKHNGWIRWYSNLRWKVAADMITLYFEEPYVTLYSIYVLIFKH